MKTNKFIPIVILFSSIPCFAAPALTMRDLEAAQQSFAVEAALEGCWIRKEESVPCEDKNQPDAKCISIQVKKVPCADEKKPESTEKKNDI